MKRTTNLLDTSLDGLKKEKKSSKNLSISCLSFFACLVFAFHDVCILCVCEHVCTSVNEFVFMHISGCVHVSACMHVCMCVCMCVGVFCHNTQN